MHGPEPPTFQMPGAPWSPPPPIRCPLLDPRERRQVDGEVTTQPTREHRATDALGVEGVDPAAQSCDNSARWRQDGGCVSQITGSGVRK